jgi:putative peptidoglycan lipid II flippase
MPSGGWRDPAVRRVVTLFLPMMAGTGVAQLSTVIDIEIATFLGNEGVATLAYAQRLYTLPLSLFGVAITQVALPTFAHEAVTGAGGPEVPGRIREQLGTSWRRMAYFVLPSSLGLAAFGRPAVSLLFEHGAFDARDTMAVTWVLAAYAAGLMAYASTRLFATAFYALQDTRTPVRVALVALAANIALGIGLAWWLGTPGIALATALASSLNAILLARRLRRRLVGLFAPGVVASVRSMAVAVAAAALVGAAPYVWLLDRWDAWSLGPRLAATVGLYLLVGGAYLLVARMLGVRMMLPRRTR